MIMNSVLMIGTHLILMSASASASTQELNQVCEVKPIPLDQVDLANRPTDLKLDMSSTSRRVQIQHGAFHLLGEGDVEVLSLFGMGIHVSGRTLAYVCLKLDEQAPQDDRLEILFYAVDDRDQPPPAKPIVRRRPLQVTWEPLQAGHTLLDGLFGGLPLIGAVHDAVGVAAHGVHARMSEAVAQFKAVGVDRIVVTRDRIEMSVGISVFNLPIGFDATPIVYTIPLKMVSDQ